jgi:hypothetical protein
MSEEAMTEKPIDIKKRFQKCLRLAAKATNPAEREAAERAARQLMAAHGIDPVTAARVLHLTAGNSRQHYDKSKSS